MDGQSAGDANEIILRRMIEAHACLIIAQPRSGATTPNLGSPPAGDLTDVLFCREAGIVGAQPLTVRGLIQAGHQSARIVGCVAEQRDHSWLGEQKADGSKTMGIV